MPSPGGTPSEGREVDWSDANSLPRRSGYGLRPLGSHNYRHKGCRLATSFDSTADTVFARVRGTPAETAIRRLVGEVRIAPGGEDTTLFTEVLTLQRDENDLPAVVRLRIEPALR